jgi:hypothetical protein
MDEPIEKEIPPEVQAILDMSDEELEASGIPAIDGMEMFGRYVREMASKN